MARDTQQMIIQLSARLDAYDRSMRKAVQQTNKTAATIERRFDRMAGDISRKVRLSLGTALGGVGAGLGTRQLIRYADGWTNVANRLAAVGVATTEVASRQEQLYQIAIRSRTAFESVANSYSRLKLSSEALGLADTDLLRITETLSKAMQVGGATAQEAAAAALQLSQAIGSGFLQGDELRSIRESAPVLAQAIAREFGVTVGELKKLGEEGQLTSDRVAQAILKASEKVDGAFSKMRLTISQAGTNVESAFQKYIGSADSSLGVTQRVAAGLQALADNMDVVMDVTLALAAIIASAFLGRALNPMLAALVTTSKVLSAVAASFVSAGLAGAQFTTYMIGATTATNGFARAGQMLRALFLRFGPGGLITVAATALVLFGDALLEVFDNGYRAQEAMDAYALAMDLAQRSQDAATAGSKDLAEQLYQEAEGARLAAIQENLLAKARLQAAMARVTSDPEGAMASLDLAPQLAEIDRNLRDLAEPTSRPVVAGEGGRTGGAGGAGKDEQKRRDALADLQAQIELNDQLIKRFAEGEEALANLRAAYEALAEAKKLGFAPGSAEFDAFIMDRATLARQENQLKLLKEGAELTASLRTREEERAATLANLQKLLDAGAISQEVYNEAVKRASEEYERQQALIEGLADFGERAFDRIGGAITDAFAKGEIAALDFKDIVNSVLSEILQEMIRLAILNPLKNAIFGDALGAALPTIFDAFGGGSTAATTPTYSSMAGRGVASGGAVSAGRAYTVGETGRELFVPEVGGSVLPASATARAMGGGGNQIVQIVTDPDLRVRTERSQSGQTETLRVLVDKVTAQNMRQPGTQTYKAQRQKGVRDPLTRL